MTFNLFWNDELILKTKKTEFGFLNEVFAEALEKGSKEGLPVAFFANISAISDELPYMIKERIPNARFLERKIKDTDDLEKQMLEYINETKCARVTDRFTLTIDND